ncbi:sigma-70 family RNA polymerase sigma factor [Marinilabiliaceae bacterium JC017]|nr:sigma-70 family RNA polymerase sigma factor [Marinilabiliaceae bacterium JC017]
MKNIPEIIKQCQKGKCGAQKILYETFAPRLFGVCLQYCKDRTEAEDCLQDGFIKIFTKIESFKFQGSFEGWMRRIMVNTVIETYRKKQPTTNIEDLPLALIDEDSDNVVESDFSISELLTIIQELPPKYKLVFNLYALEGYTHDEIAKALNISVGTSKSNLFRARKWLKEKLEPIMAQKNQAVC